jgi:hypothetical protein
VEGARQSWCDPAGESPAEVRSSVREVVAARERIASNLIFRTLGGFAASLYLTSWALFAKLN